MTSEKLAEQFHDAYEELAPAFSYKTRKASAVPWKDVPEQNKHLMVAVAERVMVPAIKQARAEVLATQREYLDRYQKFTELPEELRPYVEQVNKIVTEIRTLALEVQPAARDLEALLRDERLDEHLNQRNHNPRGCSRCPEIKPELGTESA